MIPHARSDGLRIRMGHCYGRNDGRLGGFLRYFDQSCVPAVSQGKIKKKKLPSHLMRRARHIQQPVRALEIEAMASGYPAYERVPAPVIFEPRR